jgi:hypothetical protein
MAYSYTEKKRIRKSFAKRANVLDVPFLLATQIESYTRFLQADVPPAQRRNEGLQAAFTSIFPIVAHSGNARLDFVEYMLGEPTFDVKECQQRGLTFASPLRAKVRLELLDRDTKAVKEVKEDSRSLHGRDSADDHHGLLRHQRHRARHRFPVAPFARRVFRARQGQDPQLGQAAVLGAHHSLSRLLAGFRIRSEGHPVLPHRPPPQDARDHPAQVDRHDA